MTVDRLREVLEVVFCGARFGLRLEDLPQFGQAALVTADEIGEVANLTLQQVLQTVKRS